MLAILAFVALAAFAFAALVLAILALLLAGRRPVVGLLAATHSPVPALAELAPMAHVVGARTLAAPGLVVVVPAELLVVVSHVPPVRTLGVVHLPRALVLLSSWGTDDTIAISASASLARPGPNIVEILPLHMGRSRAPAAGDGFQSLSLEIA